MKLESPQFIKERTQPAVHAVGNPAAQTAALLGFVQTGSFVRLVALRRIIDPFGFTKKKERSPWKRAVCPFRESRAHPEARSMGRS